MNSRTQSPRGHHSPMAGAYSPRSPMRTPITRIYRASSQNDASHGQNIKPSPSPRRHMNLPPARYPYHRAGLSPSNLSPRVLSPPASPRHQVAQSPRTEQHRYYAHSPHTTTYRTANSPRGGGDHREHLNAPQVVLPSDVHNGRSSGVTQSAYTLSHHAPPSPRYEQMEHRVHSVHDQHPSQQQTKLTAKASIPHIPAKDVMFRGTPSPRDDSSIGRSPKKVRLMPEESEYALRHSVGHQTSKSVSSLTRTDSDHSTSFYTATATTAYTQYTGVSSPHRRGDGGGGEGGDAVAPCDGDPFWDYYRTIGNIARANSYELINVMKFISADHIIKFFLQSWLQSRIEPTELPHANEAILSKMKYTKRTRKSRRRDHHGKGGQNVSADRKSKALRSLTMSAAPKMERIESARHDQFDDPMPVSMAKQFTMNPNDGGFKFDALRMCSSQQDRHRESEDIDEEDEEEEDAFSSARGDLFSGSASQRRGRGQRKPFSINSMNSSVSSMSTVNTQSTITVPRYVPTAPDSVIYSTKSTNSKMDLSLSHSSLTKFVQQSLAVCDEAAKHPDCFHIPRLMTMKRNLREKAIVFMQHDANRRYRHRVELLQFMHFDEAHRWRPQFNDEMNRIGSTVLSFCEQSTFLSASRVSRSWFYCSRFATSRSHIQLRLYNVLRSLTKHKELLDAVSRKNGIIAIDELLSEHNAEKIRNAQSAAPRYDADSDSDESDLNFAADRNELEEEELRRSDLFISCVSGSNDHESSAEFIGNMLLQKGGSATKEDDNDHRAGGGHNDGGGGVDGVSAPFHFPHFFSRRTECSLFSSVAVLQIDLSILSQNGLMYFVDETLCSAFWEMAFSLFRIEGLRSIDLVLPDPHCVLLSYMVSNIERINVRKSEVKFPSIGIPKNKFLCISKELRSLSFVCKSLSTAKLVKMLDTHFEHYFHPEHHRAAKGAMEQCPDRDDAHFVHFVRRQASALYFKSLDCYQLMLRTIQKPLLYDITHALYYLNRRPCGEVNTVDTLRLSDVRCAAKELHTFLNHNANALRTLEVEFTECGVLRAAPSLHGRGYSNLSKTKRGSNHNTPSAQSSGSGHSQQSQSGGSGTGHSGSANPNDEDTGFPDVAVMHQKRPKSSTQKRIIQNMNEVLDAVLRYLTVSTAKLRDYNGRVRAKRRGQEQRAPLTLPLDTLALSFPTTDFGEESLCGVFDIFKVLETASDEVRLRTLYLNGCMLKRGALRKANWTKILQSQQFERLYLQQMVYTESFFESASKVWSHSLLHLELSLLFDPDPRTTPQSLPRAKKGQNKAIKRLFVALEKCHKLETLTLDFGQKPGFNTSLMAQYSPYQHGQCGYDSRSSSSAQRRRSSIFGGNVLPQLPQSLPRPVDHSPSLSAVSGGHESGCSPSTSSMPPDYHLMEPVLDVWWIHKFMLSQNIRRSLRSLRLTFNELSTARFESHRHGPSASPKFKRFNQAHGQILRISESFSREVEQLMMSWFSKCDALTEMKMTRKLATMDTFDALNRTPYSMAAKDTTADDREVDFDRDISVFSGGADGVEESDDDVVQFSVQKWRVGNVYKGGVEGDLVRLLMPEIPIG